MKTYSIKIVIPCIILSLFLGSCEDVLNRTPPSSFTEEVVWEDMNLANSYLNAVYSWVASGFGESRLSALSDEVYPIYSRETHIWTEGLISPSNKGPWGEGGALTYTGWDLYSYIQGVNVFLDKIDKLPEAYKEPERTDIQNRVNIMKGEAIFIRAFFYSKLVMSYGGVPILTTPNGLNDDFSTVVRASFEETVNFIADECDRAADLLLNKEEMEMGRANRGAAMALKSRVLLFAASDLTADGKAKNAYVGYENPDRRQLWNSAKNAAKAVMEMNFQLEDFGAPDQASVALNYYNLFREKDLSSSEIIWGKMFLRNVGPQHAMNLWMGPNGNNNWGGLNPTQDLVDSYQMEDGSDFNEHFEVDSKEFYVNKSTKFTSNNPYKNREPRFYGTILYDSAVWQPRFENLVDRDPIGIYEVRSHVYVGSEEYVIPGLDTRQSSIEWWNGSYTGYVMKKLLDHEVIGRDEMNQNVWIEFRLAEVILNYAEACLGLGEIEEAASHINQIRNRAGLPNFKGDIVKALRYERRIELVFEEIRWYDMRRWKILDETVKDVYGIAITETHTSAESSTTWKKIFVAPRGPVHEKMYWIPIGQDEISRAPQLIQNPDY
jgi:hypothetical protein